MAELQTWHYLVWPFLACLVLTGIHCYLGLHVVARGVIFVDLSLAQVAFLGSAASTILAHVWLTPVPTLHEHAPAPPDLSPTPRTPAVRRLEAARPSPITEADVARIIPPERPASAPGSPSFQDHELTHLEQWAAYGGGLLFTLMGAALFAFTSTQRPVVPQESIIGIVYAMAAALTIIVIYKSPLDILQQTESMLAGRILFVQPEDILYAAVLYTAVALGHVLCWKPFSALSFYTERLGEIKGSLKLWDFLFYATFGMVVTSSVQMAGVLLVFSFLIVPAVASMLIATRLINRLLIGWLLGFVASSLGIVISVVLDAPTGASIVLAFGLILLLALAYRASRGRLLRRRPA
jgi:ABC-type Mn2+/Zn2+ transport system permease subunit